MTGLDLKTAGIFIFCIHLVLDSNVGHLTELEDLASVKRGGQAN